jgi:hypothetical protein
LAVRGQECPRHMASNGEKKDMETPAGAEASVT